MGRAKLDNWPHATISCNNVSVACDIVKQTRGGANALVGGVIRCQV